MQGVINTKKIAYSAVMVAFLGVTSGLIIPTPSQVPFTLAVFAVSFSGYFLGITFSLFTVLIYIIAGGVGLPIFSGFTGGFGILLGVTGGFIFGYIPLAIFSAVGEKFNKTYYKLLFGFIGLICCHLLGAMQYSLVSRTPFFASLLVVSLPYLLKDVILVTISQLASKKLKRVLLK